jgi:hypothetical protein
MRLMRAVLAAVLILLLPTQVLACGGCTDRHLGIALPWVGFGIFFVWLWVVVMVGARLSYGASGWSTTATLVRGPTLVGFALLSSAGYFGLAILFNGSALLPSLLIGFIWAVYVVVRLVADGARFVAERDPKLRAPILIHGVFLVAAIALIVRGQVMANTLEYCIGRLGYSTVFCSNVMRKIVAKEQEAVDPLIREVQRALDDKESIVRKDIITHATFCLAYIGGPKAEKFLADLVKRHADPGDSDFPWYTSACLSYAHCAGPRAVDDLTALFEKTTITEHSNVRTCLLAALAITGSRRGVAFVLDHMELLLQQSGGWSEEWIVEPVAECLVFGDDPTALTKIPICQVFRPRDAVESSEPHTIAEIASAWKKDSTSIRNRWTQKFKETDSR